MDRSRRWLVRITVSLAVGLVLAFLILRSVPGDGSSDTPVGERRVDAGGAQLPGPRLISRGRSSP